MGRQGNKFKSNRMAYCRKEQERIVQWIIENRGYNELRGNLLWKKMESDKVSRGRSYQSLKEHFRKVIITQIHTFKLSEDIVDNFKVGMGLKEDDTVKTRITLIQKPSTSTTFRPEPRQHDDTDSHHGKHDDGSSETLPARQPITQSPTRTPPRNDVLDSLLNNSSHNEEEVGYEVSNSSTELGLLDTPTEHMETVEDRKRLRQFPLYSDGPLDSPCDPNTPFRLKR